MGKIRCMLAVMAMAIGTGVAYAGEGNSEKDYRPYPHMFFGLNGGAQVSFTHYDFSKLITPSYGCLLYTSPSPRDVEESRMPSSA